VSKQSEPDQISGTSTISSGLLLTNYCQRSKTYQRDCRPFAAAPSNSTLVGTLLRTLKHNEAKMVFRRTRKTAGNGGAAAQAAPSANNSNTDGDDDIMIDDDINVHEPSPVTDLLGLDTSAISLDGRSIVVPDQIGGGGSLGGDFDEDMSSLGTGKYTYGSQFAAGAAGGTSAIGYIGDMRIIGRASDYDDVAPHPSQPHQQLHNQLPMPPPPPGSPPTSKHKRQSSSKTSSSRHKTTTNTSITSHQQQQMQQENYHGDTSYANIGADYSVNDNAEAVLPAEDDENKDKKKNSKDVEDEDGDDDGICGCCPAWLVTAPFWLKIVIVSSTALLIGAVVLIGIGASFAIDNNGKSSSSSASPGGGDNDSPNMVPTVAPMDDIFNNYNPSNDGQQQQPIQEVTTSPTATTTTTPGLVDATILPTAAPVPQPSNPPMDSGVEAPVPTTGGNSSIINNSTNTTTTPNTSSSTVSFYVIGGRFDGEGLDQLTSDLALLPTTTTTSTYTDSSFPVMFHLGDWNSPFATSCDEASYLENVDTYTQSTVPVYFVPGDNEFNGTYDITKLNIGIS
jgi:hypothetical protein